MAYPNGMLLSRTTPPAGTRPFVQLHAKHSICATPVQISRGTGGRQCCRRGPVTVRAEKGGDRFMSGFIFGGVVGAFIGWALAPQISSIFLDENDKLKLRAILEPEKDKKGSTDKDVEEIKEELQSQMKKLTSEVDAAMRQVKDNPKTVPGYGGASENT